MTYVAEDGTLYCGDSDRRPNGRKKNKLLVSRAYMDKWRDENREHKNQHAVSDYMKDLKGWYRSVKAGAKARGIPFELKLEDLYLPETCPVLGIPIVRASGERTGNAPSVDRIDSAKGYTRDNIRVISWRANNLKRDASLDEMRRIVSYMEKFLVG